MSTKVQKFTAAAVLTAGLVLTGCSSQADTVSDNLSKEADSFNVERRIAFINGITDKYLLTIEGKCSIKDANGQLEVTCKTGDDSYKKHFLRLSDNVSYVVEQVDDVNVDPFHYEVIFRPESIVPDINMQTSGG